MFKVSTSRLTQILEDAVAANPPPMSGGRRIKLRYAHLGGHNPPIIVIHGNQTGSLPKSYQRYLENEFRKVFKLEGTPLRVEFKLNTNPYAGKKTTSSKKQRPGVSEARQKRRDMKYKKGSHKR